MDSTKNLLDEHLIVRRLGTIAKKCSDGLYMNQNIPIEDIRIISIVIEEFVDAFHQRKEKKVYFQLQKTKNNFSE
jgi:hemerythrin-like domain-containing protein